MLLFTIQTALQQLQIIQMVDDNCNNCNNCNTCNGVSKEDTGNSDDASRVRGISYLNKLKLCCIKLSVG